MTTAPCIDCGFETVPDIGKCEWYMVHDAVWFAAGMPKRPIGYEGDWLCIGCLERRLDRMLSRADFKYPDSHNDECDTDRVEVQSMRAVKMMFGILCCGIGVAFAVGTVDGLLHPDSIRIGDLPPWFLGMFAAMFLLGGYLLLRPTKL